MNTYGNKFRLSIFGESHGNMLGVILDGVPAAIALATEDFLPDLARRKSGAKGTTPRKEDDLPQIVSGIYDGYTTGAPLTIIFHNGNTRSGDYSTFRELPRPGHSDFVAQVKHNSFNDIRGGGHFSGRITLALVAAGVVAKKLIGNIKIEAVIKEIGGVKENWQPLINQAVETGDSLGGLIECSCKNVPVGLGDPFFNSLESQIAHLVFSIPATRGIEFGDGFKAAAMKGSQHNDCYINSKGHTSTNGAGGINGGISNGNPIVFRVAIKPTSSICAKQTSFNFKTNQMEEFSVKGRHDSCIALRCPVIIEAVTAIVFANA